MPTAFYSKTTPYSDFINDEFNDKFDAFDESDNGDDDDFSEVIEAINPNVKVNIT